MELLAIPSPSLPLEPVLANIFGRDALFALEISSAIRRVSSMSRYV